jgi:hypothetical protein
VGGWVGGREGGREEKAEKMKCVGVARKPGFVKRAKEQTNQVCKEYEEKEGGGGRKRERESARASERNTARVTEREISYKVRRNFSRYTRPCLSAGLPLCSARATSCTSQYSSHHTHTVTSHKHTFTQLLKFLFSPLLYPCLSRSLARTRAHFPSLSLCIQESPRLRRTRREAGCGRQRQGRWGRCCYVHVRLKSMHIRAHKYSHIPTLNTHPHAGRLVGDLVW